MLLNSYKYKMEKIQFVKLHLGSLIKNWSEMQKFLKGEPKPPKHTRFSSCFLVVVLTIKPWTPCKFLLELLQVRFI